MALLMEQTYSRMLEAEHLLVGWEEADGHEPCPLTHAVFPPRMGQSPDRVPDNHRTNSKEEKNGMKKRLLASLMALCLLVGLFPTAAVAAWSGDASGNGTKEKPWDISAEDGSSKVTAYLTSNEEIEATYGDVVSLSVSPATTYTLHIEGTGAMKDFDHPTLEDSTDFAPWYSALKREGVATIPITSISLGDNITYLGDYAFTYTDVTEAVFGNISGCGRSVYAECDNLTALDWDEYPLTTIPIGLLDGCDNYKGNGENNTLVLPDKITSIGQAAFRSTSIGGALVLGKNISSLVDGHIFYGTDITSVKFENPDCTITGSATFQACSSLTSIDLPDNIQEIPANTFRQCTGLTSYEVPSSVKTIGDYAFLDCSSLKEISFEETSSLKSIGTQAFEDTGLEVFDMPDTVTSVGSYIFNHVEELKTLSLSNSLTSIHDRAFENATGLEEVEIDLDQSQLESVGAYAF